MRKNFIGLAIFSSLTVCLDAQSMLTRHYDESLTRTATRSKSTDFSRPQLLEESPRGTNQRSRASARPL
ncbi:MAG: hypothetical protein LBL30_00560 [Holosporales bacterium]|jgi:hypothetical protein|nr:hypothetical protein [Holosporales bacterium]